ncbi:MAG: nucleotidyltransferase domain-containing protein [Thermoplasmataceae archaeon]
MSIDEIVRDRKKIAQQEIGLIKKWSTDVRSSLGDITLILFGSYSRGDFNLWSDVDLILVSNAFRNVRYLDRRSKFPEIDQSADIICWTTDEFVKSSNKPDWKKALETALIIRDDYGITLMKGFNS